jgi:dUTP pyrophosphatase
MRVGIAVLPGGTAPQRQTDGAAGYDVSIRAIVSGTAREPGQEHLRKTLFDFQNPALSWPLSHFIREISNDRGENEWVYELRPRGQILVGLGFILEMPPWLFCDVRPRSGLLTLRGLEVANGQCPIDSDYRGEPAALLRNSGDEPILLSRGMRVGQLVFGLTLSPRFDYRPIGAMSQTERGHGAFGSTGV